MKDNKNMEGLFEILKRGNWGHKGRPGKKGGSSPGKSSSSEKGIKITTSPIKAFVRRHVFKSYVPVAETKGKSEKWKALNKEIGGLEARVGHYRKDASKFSGKNQRLFLHVASTLQRRLDRAVSMRDGLRNISTNVNKREENKLSEKDITQISSPSIVSEAMEEAIKAAAKEFGMTEEEIMELLEWE
jgi:hypothetical protein